MAQSDFNYHVDRFADIEVLRYKVPDFNSLTLNQKRLVYYLSEAALWGRDILWDQHYKHNLVLRQMLETVYQYYDGSLSDTQWLAFEKYVKQVEFANGIHHHYSTDKFIPEFSSEWLAAQLAAAPQGPWTAIQDELLTVIFDPTVDAKGVNQTEGDDLIATSANNLYADGLTQEQVEAYWAGIKDPNDASPVMYGYYSRMALQDGKVIEQPYRLGGLYSEAIRHIIDNLTLAQAYAESDAQRLVIARLIDVYTTADLRISDDYWIKWTEQTDSRVDFINSFIETYGDPLGMIGNWESIVNYKDIEASHRTEVLSDSAQWFEDHSPVDPKFRKPHVRGVSAKVINAAILAGDSYPSSPIGINLPNSLWIRAAHGSKSVTIANLTLAYAEAAVGNGFNQEFVIDQATSDLMDKYLYITDNLHTDLHECLGHGSGILLPGVDDNALKAHGSTIEEARADLFALYYLADPMMLQLGLLDNPDAYKAEYYKYILNGLMTQLVRIEPGKNVEESHMRNRQLIAAWCYEHGKKDKVIELVRRSGKTYIRINDYAALRGLFGQLLAEIQRIRSTGDYQAAANMVETYAVRVDQKLHKEVLRRYASLNIAPYKGFVNPVYTPVYDAQGNITDVTISFTEDFLQQQFRYSRDYSPLTK